MAILFSARDLQITQNGIHAAAGTFAIHTVRAAWVTHRRGRGRLVATLLWVAALLVLIGGAGLTGLLRRYWPWLLASPVLILLAAWAGLLDPVAIYREKRYHELWITTDTGSVRLWRHNLVEVRKALRAIQRARERQLEQFEA